MLDSATTPSQDVPSRRPRLFVLWWWAVVVAAVVAATVVVLGSPVVRPEGDGALIVLLVLVVAGELRPIIASRQIDPDGVNLATAVHFAILLGWGIVPTLVGVVLATYVGEMGRRKPQWKALYNVSQYALSYLAAWGVLWLAGWDASLLRPAELRPSDLLLVAAAGATYHVVNILLVGTVLALFTRSSWWAATMDNIGWYTLTTMAVLAIGPLIVVVVTVHWGFLVLMALPMWLIYAVAKLALDREHHASTDTLTGLANRDQLDHLLGERRDDLVRTGRHLALCVVDLDRFKEVNDTLGHATGDALLRAVAGRMSAAVRAGDAVVRLGGDEFVLLLEVDDRDVITDVVERIAAHVHEPYDLAGVRLEVSMSVGVAVLGQDGDDLDTLMRRADLAMYDAKDAGEVVSVYREELGARLSLSGELLADLRRAMAAGEIELHYQPQVALPSGTVIGVEALVRWRHPERGLLPPGAFLPVIERTSVMRQLTLEILDLALAQCARWRRIGLVVPVSVNVSMYDLADATFARRVLSGLDAHGLAAEDLILEVTEQAIVGDVTGVTATLDAVAAAGIELSIDDFGTGHASLTRLALLPVREVKVDRQFVNDLVAGSPTVVAIVRSVLELARAIDARTVAEGVENQAQWDALAALGCDGAQGWLIGRPMPWNEITRWLIERDGARGIRRPSGVGQHAED